MSNRMKALGAICAAVLIFASAAPSYALVIGDWESMPASGDGWIDWGQGQAAIETLPEKYSSSTIGATLGSQSLKVIQSGWGQSLAIKLNETQRAAFMAGNKFSIDVTVAANDGTITSGYSQISAVYMNADGPGFTAVASDNPVNFYWWSGSGQRTQTLVVDYTAFKEQITSPGYIEIIFALNTGGGAPPEMYFDNAQILLPASYEELVREDKPVLYLKFEEMPLVDSSENSYWTQAGSGASLVPSGGIGNAVYLNGSSAGLVAASVLGNPGWGGTYQDDYAFAPDDITFEFWAKIESITRYGMFFQQIGPYTRENYAPGFGQAADEGVAFGTLRVLNGTDPAEPNHIDFWYPGVETPSDGGWHHYVVTYDEEYNGNPAQMQIQLFVDGELVGSTVVGREGYPAKLGPEQDHLVIGGENNRGYVYNTVTGDFDEFAIYAGVLSSERAAAHYAQGRLEIEPQNCEQVFQRQQGLAADFNRDCVIDLNDFVYIAESWMMCNDPALFETDPTCKASW